MSMLLRKISAGSGIHERAMAVAATISGLAGISAAATVGMASFQPAHAQDFQSEMDALFGTVCGSGGPGCTSLGVAGGPGGQVEVQGGGRPSGIEQRLREVQCEADENANCLQPGGAGRPRQTSIPTAAA